jgi:cobalt-zinc-cadmium efflux system membrane fusion protein
MLDADAQRNIGLKLEAAQVRTIVETIQTTGTVGPNETRVARIRALAPGRVEKAYVRVGDRVTSGQPLVVYDNIVLGELIAEYRSATAGLERANAEAEVTKRSLERAKNLVELGAVAKAEFERREAEHKNALASINSRKAEIAKLEEKLHRFGYDVAQAGSLRPTSVLRSPFDGVVIKSDVAEGEVVGPERELFTVADLTTVWVQADVYEKDIASIRQGQDVKVLLDAYPGETFKGKITYISDFLDSKTRTTKVRCEVGNRDGRLKLEMFATIQIPGRMSREAVMVPATAVQDMNGRSVVFVKISETQFQKRAVQPGVRGNGWIEITSGLKPGEQVVTEGGFLLKSELKKKEFGEGEH